MAIIGGGGHSSDDPLYVDTLESLKAALADEVNAYKYIAFPEVYDGPKVIDLRSAGWNPINIESPHIDGRGNEVYIYFNNWTILGLSLIDSEPTNKTFFNGYGDNKTYIYDLIIKNAYILAAESNATMFQCNEGESTITFYRCKFSMCLDSQNYDVIAFQGFANGGYNTERHMDFYQCSFNLNLVTRTTSGITRLYHQNYAYGSFVNCIFSIVASHHRCSTSSNNLLYCRQLQFCKLIGTIEHVEGDQIRLIQCSSSGGTVYNVIDMDVIDYCNRVVTLYIYFEKGTSIIDSSKVVKAPGATNSISINSSSLVQCTTAQMQDQDYLNSIEFICGDTPT